MKSKQWSTGKKAVRNIIVAMLTVVCVASVGAAAFSGDIEEVLSSEEVSSQVISSLEAQSSDVETEEEYQDSSELEVSSSEIEHTDEVEPFAFTPTGTVIMYVDPATTPTKAYVEWGFSAVTGDRLLIMEYDPATGDAELYFISPVSDDFDELEGYSFTLPQPMVSGFEYYCVLTDDTDAVLQADYAVFPGNMFPATGDSVTLEIQNIADPTNPLQLDVISSVITDNDTPVITVDYSKTGLYTPTYDSSGDLVYDSVTGELVAEEILTFVTVSGTKQLDFARANPAIGLVDSDIFYFVFTASDVTTGIDESTVGVTMTINGSQQPYIASVVDGDYVVAIPISDVWALDPSYANPVTQELRSIQFDIEAADNVGNSNNEIVHAAPRTIILTRCYLYRTEEPVLLEHRVSYDGGTIYVDTSPDSLYDKDRATDTTRSWVEIELHFPNGANFNSLTVRGDMPNATGTSYQQRFKTFSSTDPLLSWNNVHGDGTEWILAFENDYVQWSMARDFGHNTVYSIELDFEDLNGINLRTETISMQYYHASVFFVDYTDSANFVNVQHNNVFDASGNPTPTIDAAPAAVRQGDYWILTLEVNMKLDTTKKIDRYTIAGVSGTDSDVVYTAADWQASVAAGNQQLYLNDVTNYLVSGPITKYTYELWWQIDGDEASFVDTSGNSQDNAILDFSITFLDVTGAPNTVGLGISPTFSPLLTPEEQWYLDNEVRYYAPIVLSDVKMENNTSGFTTTEQIGTSVAVDLAANTHTVKLSFTTTHPIVLESLEIAGIADNPQASTTFTINVIAPTTSSSSIWKYEITYILPNNAETTLLDSSIIPFKIEVGDSAYNDKVEKTVDNTGGESGVGNATLKKVVKYYAPIVVMSPEMKAHDTTENPRARTDVAKYGDTITVDLTSNHPITLSTSPKLPMVAGQSLTASNVTSPDNITWNVTFQLQLGTLNDQDIVPLEMYFTDATGQTYTLDYLNHTQDNFEVQQVQYYAPIVVEDVKFTSTNAKGPGVYAKDGDEIAVTFNTNHKTQLSSTSIAGSGASSRDEKISEDTLDWAWTMSYTMQNKAVADLSNISFYASVRDVANNEAQIVDNKLVNNTITYYEPIEAVASIESNGRSTDYAKNGDTITVDVTANHEVDIGGSIAGRGATGTAAAKDVAVSYAIPANEATIPEGILPFTVNLEDKAGNVLEMSETNDAARSQVTYDRTAPLASFAPAFNGYTNEALQMTIVYSDTNIDGSGLVLEVNGGQILGSVSPSGESYSFPVVLEEDGEYTIRARATDLAGNETVMDTTAWVILDSQEPVIRLFADATRVFKGGFMLQDVFEIEEEHVKDIHLTLTDSTGVQDWTLEAPITDDGKKTVYMMVTDMAGNTSIPMTFDFFIDGTPPAANVSVEMSSQPVREGRNNVIQGEKLTLAVRLEALHIGDENPDQFTELRLLDANGKLVADLLNYTPDETNTYYIPVEDYGEYTLVLNAIDDVGNQTGQLQYPIHFRGYTLLMRWYLNKPAFYGGSAGLLVLCAVALWFILLARRRHRETSQEREIGKVVDRE